VCATSTIGVVGFDDYLVEPNTMPGRIPRSGESPTADRDRGGSSPPRPVVRL
jgi:hypothetical protein